MHLHLSSRLVSSRLPFSFPADLLSYNYVSRLLYRAVLLAQVVVVHFLMDSLLCGALFCPCEMNVRVLAHSLIST